MYFRNIAILDFGQMAFFANLGGALGDAVRDVLRVCAPLKVFKPVVRWVMIRKVSAFHAFWAGACEGAQYYPMNQKGSGAIVVEQRREQVTEIVRSVQPQFLPCGSGLPVLAGAKGLSAPYTAIVPHSVQWIPHEPQVSVTYPGRRIVLKTEHQIPSNRAGSVLFRSSKSARSVGGVQ